MLLWISLGVCALLVAMLFLRYDMFDKEPWWLLGGVMGIGAAAMFAAGTVEDKTIALFGIRQIDTMAIAAVAAGWEEFIKIGIVVIIAVIARSRFNDPMDGLIYGTFAGLGMAIEESVYFLRLDPNVGNILPPAEIVRLLGHPIMGGIAGFGVGYRIARPRHAKVTLAACFTIALTLHFFWDCIALGVRVHEDSVMSTTNKIAAVLLMSTGMFIYGRLVVVGSRASKALFNPEAKTQLWGWPFNRAR